MKKTKRLIAYTLTLLLLLSLNISALAAVEVYDGEITWRANIPSETQNGVLCSATGGIGISRAANCLYTVKADDNADVATLYYFEDLTDWTNCKTYKLEGARHANGMTVDTNYLYITGWANGDNPPSPNNKIIQIDRSIFETLPEGATISVSNGNMNILQPKKINPNEAERETVPYVNYQSSFSSISRAETTNNFFVGKRVENNDDFIGIVRAQYIDGEFVVSTETEDVYLVENNLAYEASTKQDFCYLPGCGFFATRWYNTVNMTKNVILWADIDGDVDYQTTIDGKTYNCFIPDKIRVDGSSVIEYGVQKYEMFELESLSITSKRNLIANCNARYTQAYITAYQQATGQTLDTGTADCIIRITDRETGGRFLL